MPPPLLYDLDRVDLDRVLFTRDQIYERLPHRFEFMQLDGIVHLDQEDNVAIAYREVRRDDWWVRGHVPGRPIFPGVLMLESAAQLAAFVTRYARGFEGFVAFGGVDRCKFREAVVPPARLLLICRQTENRPRRIAAECQGLVKGKLVFEAVITGLPIPETTAS
ncbi:MAG: beta-hydroxyacyl-ACP dehydratase [bacterium]|nr:beta-hydroxyacyl-ACP dehydratase [bacterium]